MLATLPTAAWAKVCDKERPDWNGTPVTAVGEAIALFSNPVSLVLLMVTALAVRSTLRPARPRNNRAP